MSLKKIGKNGDHVVYRGQRERLYVVGMYI